MFLRLLFRFSLFLALFSFGLKVPVVVSPTQNKRLSFHNFYNPVSIDAEKCLEPRTEETEDWKGLISLLHLPILGLPTSSKDKSNLFKSHILSKTEYHGFPDTSRGPPDCPPV